MTSNAFPTPFIFLLLVYLFVSFWLLWVFTAASELSLVAAGGTSSSLQCGGFSLQRLPWSQSTGSRRAGFRSRGAQACLLHGM